MRVCPLCSLKYPDDRTKCFVDGAALADLQDPRVGIVLAGRYQIERVLGEGGMATVYAARHRLVDRLCAIKIMHTSFAHNDVMRERFRREAKAAQKLAHPNIIEIFDQGETDDGCEYLVMELLEGETLADRLERGKVNVSDAVTITLQIARALARAHDLQVIHRDLKPENIFLATDPEAEGKGETVKLLDFGIARSMQDARLTGAGEVFGTPQYMAPERITSIDASAPADLYSVGVMLFEMLTGQRPFDAPQIPAIFVKHLTEPVPSARQLNPSVPEALDRLIAELLAKDPKDRPVDAHRLYKDLASAAADLGIAIPRDPSQAPESSRPPSKSLPPAAIDLWVKRVQLFRQMLERVYAASPPHEVMGLLSRIEDLVNEINQERDAALEHQRRLEALDAKGREMRQRIGHAVHALGLDASEARDRLKEAASETRDLALGIPQHVERFKEAHRQILFAEGRCGFAEPYPQLSEAYREAADVVDTWRTARRALAESEARRDARKVEVEDLEFQILQLRQALAAQEGSLEAEQNAALAEVESLGRSVSAKENELSELATRLCEPLRQRPELGPLFRELEVGADAAA